MGTAILKQMWPALMLLSACSPAPTPIAVTPIISPTPIEAAAPTVELGTAEAATLTYAVLPNAADYVPLSIEANPAITLYRLTDLPPDDEPSYDLAVAYGSIPGWRQSPMQMHIAAVFNAERPPLHTPQMRALLLQSLDISVLTTALGITGVIVLHPPSDDNITSRTRLANMGYPDGLALTASISRLPGDMLLIDQLQAAGFTLSLNPPSSSPSSITLLTWHQDEQRANLVERFGAANIVDLYAIPISYLAAPSLSLSFGDEGWPLASR